MLRPRLRIPRAGALLRRTTVVRPLHSVPQLDQFKDDKSVPGLLSPAGYSTAWTGYMNHVTDRLNRLTAGTEFEQEDTLPILKSAARDPAQAATFNFASMAHNNHFFFKNLVNLQTLYEQTAQSNGESQVIDVEGSEARIPPRLKKELERNFSSIETLKREIFATAKAMFGPGFVWLVRNAQSQELRILNTYLAGSPYTAAHWRRQNVDWNTMSASRSTASSFFARTAAGAGNTTGQFTQQAPGGVDAIPILCLNTWEHVWLTDFGIEGKADFVAAWWDVIDWDKVEKLAIPDRRDGFK
ncbi:Manganese/iron superoxide dismutase [Xylaria bambusicola]|uniref:Manganese/iron superoxide dismutase n=1 Tax=Xylaria bambusicola TaxID=326684 RepID=UPI0020079BD5|nr:Manganese/iron superoxide dismutase [Xylaria bambusicola]KAI0506109.1 Manganese/iron superoxide dismutase [Xylaria bambusicola]